MTMNVKQKLRELSIDLVFFVVGSMLYAIATVVFVEPNEMAPGGISGMAIMLYNKVYDGFNVGTWCNLLNVPLVIWAICEFWKDWKGFIEFIGKSLAGLLISSFFIDILQVAQKRGVFFEYKVTTGHGDILVATIFSAVLTGFGLSLIFIRGGTTAGTDVIAKLSKRHARHMPLGKLLLCADAVIVAISGIVFENIETMVYAAIFIFVSSKIIDTMIFAMDPGAGRVMLIISNKSREIAKKINCDLNRTSTAFKSIGCYSGNEGEAIVCAVRKNEVNKIYDISKEIDTNVFIMVSCSSCEMIGSGFKSLHSVE